MLLDAFECAPRCPDEKIAAGNCQCRCAIAAALTSAQQATLEAAAGALDDEALSYEATADECVVIKRWPEANVKVFLGRAETLREGAAIVRAIRQRMEGGK